MSRITLNERQMVCGSGVIPGWDAVNYKEMVDEESGALYCIYQVGDGSDLVEVSRYIYSDAIKNNTFYLPNDLQGKGIGLRLLLQEVSIGINYGMKHIETYAMDGDDIGYHVWPRMGFDGEVFVGVGSRRDTRESSCQLPTIFNGRTKMLVSEYIKKFGQQSWIEFGVAFCGILDLQPESYSMKTLYNYAQNKGVL